MKIKTILVTALLMLSLSAAAEFTTIARAYEIALSNFRVPATPSAAAIFRQCDECDARAVRVTPSTLYVVNGQPVTLKEFRKSVFGIRRRVETTVIVKHHLETDTIVSVTVTI
jgi:hypothetical protein